MSVTGRTTTRTVTTDPRTPGGDIGQLPFIPSCRCAVSWEMLSALEPGIFITSSRVYMFTTIRGKEQVRACARTKKTCLPLLGI